MAVVESMETLFFSHLETQAKWEGEILKNLLPTITLLSQLTG